MDEKVASSNENSVKVNGELKFKSLLCARIFIHQHLLTDDGVNDHAAFLIHDKCESLDDALRQIRE